MNKIILIFAIALLPLLLNAQKGKAGLGLQTDFLAIPLHDTGSSIRENAAFGYLQLNDPVSIHLGLGDITLFNKNPNQYRSYTGSLLGLSYQIPTGKFQSQIRMDLWNSFEGFGKFSNYRTGVLYMVNFGDYCALGTGVNYARFEDPWNLNSALNGWNWTWKLELRLPLRK